jgi:hypothetical protein
MTSTRDRDGEKPTAILRVNRRLGKVGRAAALLLGSGIASLNICLWLLRPAPLIGILIYTVLDEQLLGETCSPDKVE